MPDSANKMGVPEALGGEAATRASILQSINKLIEQAAQEQFLVRQIGDVTYAGGTLSVAYGPGQIRFPSIFIAYPAGVATLVGPAAATTYFLVARSTGAVVLLPAPVPVTAGEVILYELATGNPVAPGTTILYDRRGLMPNSEAYAPSGVTPATYGGPAAMVALTIDARGRVTNASSSAIGVDAIGAAQIAAGAVGTPELAAAAVTADKAAASLYAMAGVFANQL